MKTIDSKTYWKNREEQNLRSNLKEEEEYVKEINRIYDRMMVQITKEINDFYVKYAKREGITISEAKKRVKKLDINVYAEKAKKYVKEKDFSDEANEEMRLYNLTMKVNRLELLKAQIGLELVDNFNDLQKYFDEKLTKRTLDEFKRQAGILGKTLLNNEKAAHAVVNASFHNATFSDRIWLYQGLLKNDLYKLLQTGIVQGKNPRVLAAELVKKFDVSRYNAERLMRTELARVQTEAQKQSFERNGYDEYEYIACGKSDVCDICKALDGKHFKVKDMMVGENAPPMHPMCHCSVAAHMDTGEEEEWLGEKESTVKLGRKQLENMKISMPEDVYKKSGMNKETRSKIDDAIRKLEREYTIYLDRIEGEHLKNKDIFVTGGFIDKDGVLKHSLVINYDMNYEQVEMTMKKLYNKQYMAGKDYEDYIVHEMAHILPFQNCTTKREYMELTEKIRNMFVPDVSGYADKKRDGLESLAEAFVRYRNGEEIPTKAMKLIEEYIEPWRRR